MIRAIIFDCFGVIITDALQVIISEFASTDPLATKQVIDILHANNRGFISPEESNRRIAAILGIRPKELYDRIKQGEVKDEQLLKYIGELRGTYKTAMLSNIGQQSLYKRFAKGELEKFFDIVVASGELGFMKPDPEIYLHTAEKLDVLPEQCIFIDDRETHCNGARITGMHAVQYIDLADLKHRLKLLLADPEN